MSMTINDKLRLILTFTMVALVGYLSIMSGTIAIYAEIVSNLSTPLTAMITGVFTVYGIKNYKKSKDDGENKS